MVPQALQEAGDPGHSQHWGHRPVWAGGGYSSHSVSISHSHINRIIIIIKCIIVAMTTVMSVPASRGRLVKLTSVA